MPQGKPVCLIYMFFPGIQVFSEKRLAFPCFACYFYSYEQLTRPAQSCPLVFNMDTADVEAPTFGAQTKHYDYPVPEHSPAQQ